MHLLDHAIERLRIGAGCGNGPATAKVTAVLRFLKPEEWGVVDWRTIAMLGSLEKSNGNVDQELVLSRREPYDPRKWLDMVDENWACE
jgi:hypothetical protein